MSIQSGINQLLGTAALFSQLPGGQSIAKNTKLNQQYKKVSRALEKIESVQKPDQGLRDQAQKMKGDLYQIAEERFRNRPTTGNLHLMRMAESRADYGMRHMQQEGMKQVQQRRNFKDYLSQLPTSLGGTVGQLNPQMQKQIASQYSKSQRRTIMDRMDREAKK